ncbi:uracil-DNA glycosylase [Porphyromonas sp. COT-290 OH860]|uniref:uracil-DNA glycosylase n=1 Tax=Porphyromonas sp. COT-290 OH860 TaxID=1515615 RepID=UPI00052DD4C0|nr:uracil-DNA glycosylase [Porphyromonas sp. COT-290 OH860]KGN83477.1 uracil-DNA glycosylase [Porphyromonas sp. COT-290 OH860]
MQVKIEPSWHALLADEFEKSYFAHLSAAVRREYLLGNPPIYPEGKFIFRALDLCPVDRVRLVILGQDPYHGPGQAEGLSFSVPRGVQTPPSLRNIKREILEDTGLPSVIDDGHLMPWVQQGVLLLNSILTVRAGQAGSHQGLGWESFTDAVIERLSREREHLVFLLWGAYARRKGAGIDRSKHLVLESAHPSPLSQTRFFGCKHFSQANAYLVSHGYDPIRW